MKDGATAENPENMTIVLAVMALIILLAHFGSKYLYGDTHNEQNPDPSIENNEEPKTKEPRFALFCVFVFFMASVIFGCIYGVPEVKDIGIEFY